MPRPDSQHPSAVVMGALGRPSVWIVIAFVVWGLIARSYGQVSSVAEFGDAFGFVSGLACAIATCVSGWALITQRRDLALSRTEARIHKELQEAMNQAAWTMSLAIRSELGLAAGIHGAHEASKAIRRSLDGTSGTEADEPPGPDEQIRDLVQRSVDHRTNLKTVFSRAVQGMDEVLKIEFSDPETGARLPPDRDSGTGAVMIVLASVTLLLGFVAWFVLVIQSGTVCVHGGSGPDLSDSDRWLLRGCHA